MPDIPILQRRYFAAVGDLHMRVLVAGWARIGDWWHGSAVDQPTWKLYINEDDGAEVMLSDGRRVALNARQVWLLPAGLSFNYRTRRCFGHIWIHFDPVGMSPGGVRALATAPIPVPLSAAQRGVSAALRKAARDPRISEVELRCLAKALVYLAMSSWWGGLDEAARSKLLLAVADPGLAPALARIETNLAAPLYNQALARSCGLSPSAFVRRFRIATGMSPVQYILERRIATAAEQLLVGGNCIKDISDSFGFSDRFYFTRVFSRRMGCSPAAYRANRAGTGGAAPT